MWAAESVEVLDLHTYSLYYPLLARWGSPAMSRGLARPEKRAVC